MANVFLPQYILEQSVVAKTVLYLPLQRPPLNVQIWSSEHEIVHADVAYDDDNKQLIVNWSVPFTGRLVVQR